MRKRLDGKMIHDGYPLRTVASRTGLTPDLIRAWEKRYRVVTPLRGARGARLYSADDIEHLELLARVVAAGRTISDVAALDRRQLAALAAQSQAVREEQRLDSTPVRTLLDDGDHNRVARLLGDSFIALGARAFVYQIAAPLLEEIGQRWQKGVLSIADEHVFSATLRNLVGGAIQNRGCPGRPVIALATAAGERHELGILLVALLALEEGMDVLYLGADLPAAEIASVAAHAAAVGVSLVTDSNRRLARRQLGLLQQLLPAKVELWVGGRDAPATVARMNRFRGRLFADLSAVEAELARLAAGVRAPRFGNVRARSSKTRPERPRRASGG